LISALDNNRLIGYDGKVVTNTKDLYIMAIKLNQTKANIVIDLLRANGNAFTPAQLVKAAGNDRRARSALSHARMAGVKVEAVRDGGKAVVSYRTTSTPTQLAVAPKSTAKQSKAVSPKIAAKAKEATAKRMAKEVDAIVARNKAPSKKAAAKVISAEGKKHIEAKNLETIKAVHAKVKQNVVKHPVTGRDLTDEQADALEEFRALEAGWESEEQTRNAARAAVRENLPKEMYAE
jgi:hypothetical protein